MNYTSYFALFLFFPPSLASTHIVWEIVQEHPWSVGYAVKNTPLSANAVAIKARIEAHHASLHYAVASSPLWTSSFTDISPKATYVPFCTSIETLSSKKLSLRSSGKRRKGKQTQKKLYSPLGYDMAGIILTYLLEPYGMALLHDVSCLEEILGENNCFLLLNHWSIALTNEPARAALPSQYMCYQGEIYEKHIVCLEIRKWNLSRLSFALCGIENLLLEGKSPQRPLAVGLLVFQDCIIDNIVLINVCVEGSIQFHDCQVNTLSVENLCYSAWSIEKDISTFGFKDSSVGCLSFSGFVHLYKIFWWASSLERIKQCSGLPACCIFPLWYSPVAGRPCPQMLQTISVKTLPQLACHHCDYAWQSGKSFTTSNCLKRWYFSCLGFFSEYCVDYCKESPACCQVSCHLCCAPCNQLAPEEEINNQLQRFKLPAVTLPPLENLLPAIPPPGTHSSTIFLYVY